MSICPVQTITFKNVEHKTSFWCITRYTSSSYIMGQGHGRRIMQKNRVGGKKARVGRFSGNVKLFLFGLSVVVCRLFLHTSFDGGAVVTAFCLFVCLFVSRVTQNVMSGYSYDICGLGRRTREIHIFTTSQTF